MKGQVERDKRKAAKLQTAFGQKETKIWAEEGSRKLEKVFVAIREELSLGRR